MDSNIMSSSMALTVYLLVQSIIYLGVQSLQMVRISAPDYIRFGDPLWLNCSCDLPIQSIYSIKWFKNNHEFYRYIVSDAKPKTFYNTTGIYPDTSSTEFGNIHMTQTDFQTEGSYRCEISSEVSFQTIHESKDIRVYYIPKDPNPIIIGKKSHYTVNDLVNLTCTSPLSLPAAQLTATINGTSVVDSNDARFQHRVYYQHYENNLSAASINIQFSSRLLTTRVPFECHSAISHRHSRVAEVALWTTYKSPQQLSDETTFYSEDKPIYYDNQESAPEDQSEPTITGLRQTYQMSDLLNLTCVSSRHSPVPELRWFINKHEVDRQYLVHERPTHYTEGQTVVSVRLQYSLRSVKPFKTFKTNRFAVSVKCVESLTQVLTTGKETLIIASAVEPITDNSFGAVKSYMENNGHTIQTNFIDLIKLLTISAFLMFFVFNKLLIVCFLYLSH
ncbi:uncharacterized protein LOC128962735 [Oppia nitens]|uniref:uncharacterized protein LOC128962735 n=1 Tax=Oppia nitens TaxID=1686743 RepID=UPI0023DBAB57|nr:uncharacterized protein LOC128962735 [Oppia nitens]